jgi:fructosamine-3-kinase
MSEQDDVSWKMVEQVVRDWLGPSAHLSELCFLAGGMVNTTVRVKTDCGRRAVLKISPHRVNHAHEREARELALLEEIGVPVPRVLATKTASIEYAHSYLLIDFIDGMTLRDAQPLCSEEQWGRLQAELAEMALKIHAQRGDLYGRFEGLTFTDWPAFYRSLVDPIWMEADKMNCLPIKTRKTIARIHEHLEQLLSHGDVPRLCHGDLWSGNVICSVDTKGDWHVAAVIDPELRYGHAEAELAYMDLSKTINGAFKQAYQTRERLPDNYHKVRKPIYQLYALINQLQLNGHAHAPRVIESADRLATVV